MERKSASRCVHLNAVSGFPRYATEPSELRRLPAWFYDWAAAPRYDVETHAGLRDALRRALLAVAGRGR